MLWKKQERSQYSYDLEIHVEMRCFYQMQQCCRPHGTCETKCTADTAKALCGIARRPLLRCMDCAPGSVLVGNGCDTLKCDVSTKCNNVVVPMGTCEIRYWWINCVHVRFILHHETNMYSNMCHHCRLMNIWEAHHFGNPKQPKSQYSTAIHDLV